MGFVCVITGKDLRERINERLRYYPNADTIASDAPLMNAILDVVAEAINNEVSEAIALVSRGIGEMVGRLTRNQ